MADLARARVLVIGATGFIGARVVRRLVRLQAAPYMLVRDAARANAQFSDLRSDSTVTCDVTDDDALRHALAKIRPAVTFNLAGYGVDPAERDALAAEAINARFPRVLCEALSDTRDPTWTGVSLVHVGSALEYGRVSGNLEEDCVPAPDTLYGRTKLAGTRALADCGLRSVTARLFTVYGPGEHPTRLLPSLIETARTERPLDLTAGQQRRDFTYVDDVADGLLRLACSRAEPGTVVNLATGRLETVRHFAQVAASVLNMPAHLLRFGQLPVRDAEMSHDPVSIERLRTLLDWVPLTSIAEGIRQTIEWASTMESHVRGN
jgi:nucleoside-diphosphate-sugar epimerase